MEKAEALRIIEAFANGVDPETGLRMALPRSYQEAFIVAALALEGTRRMLPSNTGQPWRADEDARLIAAFESGMETAHLARLHKRTEGAIVARLLKLGKIDENSQVAANAFQRGRQR